MAVVLETSWGDLTIDLDIDGSPDLCRNFLILARARYYTQTLVYGILHGLAKCGCPQGTGRGGASIYGYMDDTSVSIETSHKRFLKRSGRMLTGAVKGRVVALEINNVADTIGSQFAIQLETTTTNDDGPFFSLGKVVEDDNGVSNCKGAGSPRSI
jgi:cyclophilin family peptidyl-prolyl cis-trans isomerase